MSVLETPGVGLDHPESQLPARWAAAFGQAGSYVILALIGAVQLAWLGAFAYAAYLFLR